MTTDYDRAKKRLREEHPIVKKWMEVEEVVVSNEEVLTAILVELGQISIVLRRIETTLDEIVPNVRRIP